MVWRTCLQKQVFSSDYELDKTRVAQMQRHMSPVGCWAQTCMRFMHQLISNARPFTFFFVLRAALVSELNI